jgi:hypothetical protein
MSLHYEFMLAFDLKPGTPPEIIALLQYLTRTEDYAYDGPPPQPVIGYSDDDNDPWWRQMLQGRGALWYGAGSAISVFADTSSWRRDHAQYTLTIRSDALDDDFYQIWFRMFVWLAQYSATEGWVGYYREEADQQPTLIYFRQGQVYYYDIPDTVPMQPMSEGGAGNDPLAAM